MIALSQTLSSTRLRHGLTIVYCLAFAALVYLLFVPNFNANKLQGLRYVGESAGRMMERHLEFYEGYQQVPLAERAFYSFLFGHRQTVEADAAHAYREVLNHFERHPEHATSWAKLNTKTRLLVTVAETQSKADLLRALRGFGQSPEEEVIAEAVQFAYLDPDLSRFSPEIFTGASLLPVGWAADHLRLRIAERTGDQRSVDRFTDRLAAAGLRLRDHVLELTSTVAVIVVLGMLLLLKGNALRMAAPWQSRALEQPWSMQDGLGVAVRAALAGILISTAIHAFTSHYFKPGFFALWSTLFASLPMIWLIHRHLLKPRGMSFISAFGLSMRGVSWLRFIGIVLSLLAVEWLGLIAIGWSTWKLGLGGHWAEGIQERLVFGPQQTVIVSTINIVLWTAIFEEIGFRGLVYTTLRSWLNPKVAIILSALLFSAVHLYSLAGFLSVFWSGLVLAYAYERYRSLMPGIVVHAAGNMLNLSTILLFYR
jgi:membrane protease YdiL (CAAX protease family)